MISSPGAWASASLPLSTLMTVRHAIKHGEMGLGGRRICHSQGQWLDVDQMQLHTAAIFERCSGAVLACFGASVFRALGITESPAVPRIDRIHIKAN